MINCTYRFKHLCLQFIALIIAFLTTVCDATFHKILTACQCIWKFPLSLLSLFLCNISLVFISVFYFYVTFMALNCQIINSRCIAGSTFWWVPLLGSFSRLPSPTTSLCSCTSSIGWRLRSRSLSSVQSSCTSVSTGLRLRTSSTRFVRWQMSRLVSDYVLARLHHCSSAALDCLLSVNELFYSPLLVFGTVCLIMSTLHLPWLCSGPVSKLISSASRIPLLNDCTVPAQWRSCYCGQSICFCYL